MPFEGGDRASSSASNTVSRGDATETNESIQCEGGVRLIYAESPEMAPNPCPIQAPVPLPSMQYVLSPSPSFDMVFDDLLEGGGSGTSAVREYTAIKTKSNTSLEEVARKIDYLNELLRDEHTLRQLPGFRHLQTLLGREIERIRSELRLHRTPVARIDNVIQPERPARMGEGKFNLGSGHDMPVPEGPVVTVVDKVYPPIELYPEYNFIGRLIGPRGRTVKQMEQESGCLITIRGRGSENKGKHYRKWGQVAYENETEPLHVRIEATNHRDRAQFMVDRAKELVQKVLVPVDDDELKQRQLRELAMIRHGGRWDQRQIEPSNMQYPNLSCPVPVFMQPPPVQFMDPTVGLYPGLVYVDASAVEAEESGVDPSVCERTGS